MLSWFFGSHERAESNRVLVLMVSTLAFTALIPLAETVSRMRNLVEVVTVVAAVAVCATSRRALLAAVALGLPAALLSAISSVSVLEPLSVAAFAFKATLWTYVLVLMLARIFRTRFVTRETLYLAVSSYMLLGLVWSLAYVVLELAVPGAFSFPSTTTAPDWTNLYYYSFVTLTTLGYGEVVPVASAARSLAILEAVAGQMFLGMLIARLVGRLGRDVEAA